MKAEGYKELEIDLGAAKNMLLAAFDYEYWGKWEGWRYFNKPLESNRIHKVVKLGLLPEELFDNDTIKLLHKLRVDKKMDIKYKPKYPTVPEEFHEPARIFSEHISSLTDGVSERR